MKSGSARVEIKIPHWAARMWGSNAPGWIILEKEIRERLSLGDLLNDLVAHHAYLKKVVFDEATGAVSEQIMVVLNDTLVQDRDMAKCELKEGDSVTLLPLYDGG
jgi:hypothetical protein